MMHISGLFSTFNLLSRFVSLFVIVLLTSGGVVATVPSSSSHSVSVNKCCPVDYRLNRQNGQCHPLPSSQASDSKNYKTFTVPTHLVSKVISKSTPNLNLTFGLSERGFRCQTQPIFVTVDLHEGQGHDESITSTTDSGEQPGIVETTSSSLSGTPALSFYSNGWLVHANENYYPSDYCIDSIGDGKLTVAICPVTCGGDTPCVFKCCGIGEALDLSKFEDTSCKPSGEKLWQPTFYSETNSKAKRIQGLLPHFVLYNPRNWCTTPVVIWSYKELPNKSKEVFRIMRDGRPKFKQDRRRWVSFQVGNFCTDGAQSFPNEIVETEDGKLKPFSGLESDTIVFDCSEDVPIVSQLPTSMLYGVSMIISSCFLIVTIAVYFLLWEKQNVHGWTLMCYFASLLLLYLFLSAVHFSGFSSRNSEMDDGGGVMCRVIGVGAHFFFLSAFCWMSAVNFDLWWTFRSLKPTVTRSKGIKRFVAYVIICLGIPSIIVGVGLTLDAIYRYDRTSEVIVPEYGKIRCYLEDLYAPLPYLYGPVGFLLTCNLLFFVITVYAMYRIQQSTKIATSSSSKNKRQKQSMVLFAKLFLVMGIPWILDVVSWAYFSKERVEEAEGGAWYWKIVDLINIFQAVAIFLIFVFKRDTFNSLELKYPWFKRFIWAVTMRQETANRLVRRHPRFKFFVNRVTYVPAKPTAFSSIKTVSTVDSRLSTRSNVNQRPSLPVLSGDTHLVTLNSTTTT